MKKKTLGLILALLMVFSLLPASAFAANVVQSGTCGENLTWTFDDEGVLTITGTGEMTGAPWESYKDSIKSVVIGDGVTSICNNAFLFFTSLKEVSIPASITKIEADAFYCCSELTEIIIPDSVTEIGDRAFRGCSGLTKVDMSSGLKQIGDSAFYGCTGLTSIDIPDGLKQIGDSAFSGCTGLTSIDIPDGIDVISSGAFQSCEGLTDITIPNSVTIIGQSAFFRCKNLTSIDIPASVKTIDNFAFGKCTGLVGINIPDGVKEINSFAFEYCTGLVSINIPDSVTSIGGGAFEGCTALVSVNIPDSVNGLGGRMFYECSSLESVSFSNSVKYIGQNAFYGCNALKEIYFDGTDMQCAVINVEDGNDVLDDVTVYCALDYPFTDIADSGYRDYISLGQALGIVNGYPDGTFRPNNTVTRAQYITMLYNMYGKPDVSGYSLNFKDKNSISGPYVDAVKWGVAKGIINGYGDNTFRPDQQITRAQMAAFSYRLMKLAVGGEFKDEVKADCGFKDSSSIAKDYKEAVNVMANLGIITGFDTDNDGKGDTFRPNATANRGQAATIIVRVAISLGIVS